MTPDHLPILAECLAAVDDFILKRADIKRAMLPSDGTTVWWCRHISRGFAEVLTSYIHRNPRAEGELDEAYRYRASLPSGETAWAATPRELAERILRGVEK